MSRIRVSILFALLVLCGAQSASGYAVITHEAIVDSAWKDITPILLRRFPATTPEDLKKAHAYAYGGCIIQDMGYNGLLSVRQQIFQRSGALRAQRRFRRSVGARRSRPG